VACALLAPALAGQANRPPLGDAEIRAIARLLMLEDRRELDLAELSRSSGATHPEVRRRAALAIGRIADPHGRALLAARHREQDSSVLATVAFATGQLKDTGAVAWLDSLLTSERTPPTVATEAARSLGLIRDAGAREALVRYLLRVPLAAGRGVRETVGEALLALGRFPGRAALAPITRWVSSSDEEVRWRAAWALFRPRDPAALPTLMQLTHDRSAEVRSWAVRGLTGPAADSSTLGRATVVARVHALTRDTDRRTRTEAYRVLPTFDDSASWKLLAGALDDHDAWLSVSAAEGLARLTAFASASVPRLLAAAAAGRPSALRVTALQSVAALSPAAAAEPAIAMAGDTASICRSSAVPVLGRLGAAGRGALERLSTDPVPAIRLQALVALAALGDPTLDLAARRDVVAQALASDDAVVRAAALRRLSAWADSSDVPAIIDAFHRAERDTTIAAGSAAVAAAGAVQRRTGAGAEMFLSRVSRPASAVLRRDADRAFGAIARRIWGELRPVETGRSDADYRRIVERWVVPDYIGRPRPRSRWETPRGPVLLELYAGEAPIATDDFVRTVESGALVGIEFGRVVPDFVDQQRAIRDDREVRDEVNRYRLSRGNLAWASAGLDTGRPGYTLGITYQPHNEGDFTSLGRVVGGMDAVERIELGDRVSRARMLRP
jgi:HEAT repeat protein/cyclophilin family peptidyl-prolyl cis-trans isomerase